LCVSSALSQDAYGDEACGSRQEEHDDGQHRGEIEQPEQAEHHPSQGVRAPNR
jgi:hypothetical protein